MLTRTRPIRVLRVDARPAADRKSGDLAKASHFRVEVVAHAYMYSTAVELAERLHPDVILFSIFPDAMDPFDVIRQLAHRMARVLVLGNTRDSASVRKIVNAGAYAVVAGDARAERICEAIAEAHADVIAPMRGFAPGPVRRDPERVKLDQLTLREKEVIQAIAAAPSAKYLSIADRLGISEHTVHNHLSKIYQKLDLTNRIDLLIYSSRHGLAENDEPPLPALVKLHRTGRPAPGRARQRGLIAPPVSR